ncbi:GAG-pre-integrase domain - like 1 [Theobroma cacao]|nr:GAG-pre-integrase domain - like 1 [Theobroma cacao]
MLFAQLDKRKGGTVSFGDDSKGKIHGIDLDVNSEVCLVANAENDSWLWHKRLGHKVENEKGLAIVSIRSDHGGEFENDKFEKFCNEKGLDHNFSAPRTP